jgi:CheY-like chemotaxis protein
MRFRVLVIEDNKANLELVTYLLTAFGHIVVSARDGATGIHMALTTPVDVILCDLAMPEVDGYGVAKRLKAEPALASVPLIAVTASAMLADRSKVMNAGFDGYITKPITPETFVAEVTSFLSRPDEDGDHPRR